MKVLISGSRGLVGSETVEYLTRRGHEVTRLLRPNSSNGHQGVMWDPQAKTVDKAGLNGFNGVIHLAGENIASGRWTPQKKERLVASRVGPTRLLCEALASLEQKPEVLICASAIGYYGDRGDEYLTEDSEKGEGFLADLCQQWEAATQPAKDAGIRVVNARLGIILSRKGGALKKMLLPFKFGAGGVLGSGRQYMSWIHIHDVVRAFEFLLEQVNISGPVNLVAPNPVNNKTFTRSLGGALFRPTFFSVPKMGARLAFGEMADSLLLSSAAVEPRVLNKFGFPFEHRDVKWALKSLV